MSEIKNIEDLQARLAQSRKRWDDLKRDNLVEYNRQMQIADRWQSETDAMQGDDDPSATN
jgi:hypothetical protein